MRSVIKSCVFFSLFVVMNSCSAELILRFQPEINETASRLGDVLIIKEHSPTVLDQQKKPVIAAKTELRRMAHQDNWAAIPLNSHPIPGEIITQSTILDWMTQRFGETKVTWLGKTTIEVKKARRTPSNVLIETAKTALLNKLERHYINVNVIPLSHLKNSQYALDDITVKIKVPYPTTKRVCVWLSNGEKTQRTAVWFKVHAYASVLVSNHDIKQNKLLDSSAFSLKKRDIAGLQSRPLVRLPQNKWLKSSMQRNTILQETQLKDPPMIEHNQHVNVAMHHHHITIEMDAIALTDGYLGEMITVKNTTTQKTFMVKVTGIQQAEIRSPQP